ncbi:MAG: NAD(+)/NADH kinase [Bacteriovoracaceae bacterium]|nr:NAD(+)/NADH kinase [Bacteriovoracaceae bacterium]
MFLLEVGILAQIKKQSKVNISSVGIILKPQIINEYVSVLPNLCTWLKRRKISIFFPDYEEERVKKIFKTQPKGIQYLPISALHKEMDINITLGGDGTLLGFGRLAEKKSVPIFGVNMGNLGFITEFPKSEFFEGLSAILSGKCRINKIPLFKVQIHKGDKKIFESHFLNDLVISKNDISRMFSLTVENKQEHIYNLSGDGLIVSSPIGSTAYSLAAGGPIINPEVSALVLTPICPHSLTHRPIVVSDRETLQIKIPSQTDAVTLTLDGQEMREADPRSTITITKNSTRYVKIIANPNRTYFQTLKEKFTYGRRAQ